MGLFEAWLAVGLLTTAYLLLFTAARWIHRVSGHAEAFGAVGQIAEELRLEDQGGEELCAKLAPPIFEQLMA
jgi:hypothetical protein